MSKVVKGVKKIGKKIGGFVKDNWKPIVGVAATALTAGLATPGIGFAGLASASSGPMGVLGGIGSTMWAGAQSVAGTLGLGQGVTSGVFGSGAVGSTLSSAGGPLSFLAGNSGIGSAAQGTGAGGMVQNAMSGLPGSQMTGNLVNSTLNQAGGQGGGGLLSNFMNSPLAPALVKGAAGYAAQRAAEEDRRPEQVWGVGPDGEAHQPWGDQYKPAELAHQNGPRNQPLLNYRNAGQYG